MILVIVMKSFKLLLNCWYTWMKVTIRWRWVFSCKLDFICFQVSIGWGSCTGQAHDTFRLVCRIPIVQASSIVCNMLRRGAGRFRSCGQLLGQHAAPDDEDDDHNHGSQHSHCKCNTNPHTRRNRLCMKRRQ